MKTKTCPPHARRNTAAKKPANDRHIDVQDYAPTFPKISVRAGRDGIVSMLVIWPPQHEATEILIHPRAAKAVAKAITQLAAETDA